jgi:4-amino-4-deoxychorismate lyase
MILINGNKSEQIPATDRALHYGDGLFETIAIINGQPRHWAAHMARLEWGCEVLGLPSPDLQQLYGEVMALCGEDRRAVLKLVYSRGVGGRGYMPPQPSSPTRILFRYPWPDYPELSDGIRVRLCETPIACNPVLAGIKHLNRLEQVLARAEWDDPTIHEGLMCDLDGWVKEGTMSNLFWVKQGRLYTPDLSRCGVAGIMRNQVMALARDLGIAVTIDEITARELAEVDELFLTNSLIGIWPVRHFAGRDFSLGELTRGIQSVLEAKLEKVE